MCGCQRMCNDRPWKHFTKATCFDGAQVPNVAQVSGQGLHWSEILVIVTGRLHDEAERRPKAIQALSCDGLGEKVLQYHARHRAPSAPLVESQNTWPISTRHRAEPSQRSSLNPPPPQWLLHHSASSPPSRSIVSNSGREVPLIGVCELHVLGLITCVGCDIVQADHAPEAGGAQGIFHGILVRHHGRIQEEVKKGLEEEVERRVKRTLKNKCACR